MRAERALLGPLLTCGLLASGCSLAPAYHPPAMSMPVQYKEAAAAPLPGWTVATPMDGAARGAWWEAFNDPVLDDLETRAAAASPTLAAALARYDEARAQVGIAVGSEYPEIDAAGTAARDRVAAHAPGNSLGRPVTANEFQVGGTFSYDVDLWGRIRNTVKAARANAAASNDDLASARLSIQASVANAYVQLRGLDSRADLLNSTVQAYRRAYDLTTARHTGGIAAGMDVSRARSTLSSARALVSETANQRAATEHELAALVGTNAAEFGIPPQVETIALPPIPASQPSTLLQRRPDIAAAERRMFAFNAQIGVARAALFPDITLALSAGWETVAGGLFSPASTFWSLGPAQALGPIFDGGRRRSQVRLSRAQYLEAAADYRNTVLTAFQQVEDGLAALRHLSAEEVNQRDAAISAKRTTDLSLSRYRDGAADYLEVVTAQTEELNDEVTLINLETQRLQSNIALVQALGGEGAPVQTAMGASSPSRVNLSTIGRAALLLGISEFTTMPWSFEQDLECYARNGADAIEVVEAKLDPLRFAEQMAAIAAAGLTISGVQPKVRTFFASRMTPEPAALADRTAALRQSIERLGRFAPGVPFITNTGAHPRGDMAEAMRVVAQQLRGLAPVAADHGVRLALEPLNPTSVNVESAIWTVDQALTIIEDVGHDNVGICLDYWNVWQNADIKTAIFRAGDRIFTVQASDWRVPRSFADRIVPGDGTMPLSRLIAATHAAGFRGPYVTEIFSNDVADSLYDSDLDAVVSRSLSGMRAACRSAGIDESAHQDR